jgi:hypothetical protein
VHSALGCSPTGQRLDHAGGESQLELGTVRWIVLVAGRPSLAAPETGVVVAGGSPEKDRSMLTGSVYLPMAV